MGVPGVTVSEVKGFGSQGRMRERYAGKIYLADVNYLYIFMIPCSPN